MSSSTKVILNKLAHLKPTTDCNYGELNKSAANESTNTDLLKRFGEWAQNHPGTLGGLAAGAGALGINALTRDKDDSGPGLMGTLGTLGLLGGGGYLLDQLGGFKGLKNIWKAKDMAGSLPTGGGQGGSVFGGLKNKFQLAKEVGNLPEGAVDNPMSYVANNLTDNPEAQSEFAKSNPGLTNAITQKVSPYLNLLNFRRQGTPTGPVYTGQSDNANPEGYGDAPVSTYTDPATGAISSKLEDAPAPVVTPPVNTDKKPNLPPNLND